MDITMSIFTYEKFTNDYGYMFGKLAYKLILIYKLADK